MNNVLHKYKPAMTRFHKKTFLGFTMIEFVMVLIIVGILAGIMAPLIALPVKGYIDQQRRGGLVDRAQVALNILSREIRLALPNSVRYTDDGTIYVIEFLRTVTGGRYSHSVGGGNNLTFDDNPAATLDRFDVLGTLICDGVTDGATSTADCQNGVSSCLAVGYRGPAESEGYIDDFADPAATPPAITGTITSVASCSSSQVTFPATVFPLASESTNQRFYIVDTPVAYICNPTTGEIRRYHDYEIHNLKDDVDTHTELKTLATKPAEDSLVVDNISDCSFTPERNGVQINASITVTDPDSGESIELNQQITIPNGS